MMVNFSKGLIIRNRKVEKQNIMEYYSLAIFDMDGLLINSEPLWEEAEINVFRNIGVEVTLDMCQQFKGFRVDESIAEIYRQKPWDSRKYNFKSLENNILNEVENLIARKGNAMPGAIDTVKNCRALGIKTAIASSSMMKIIDGAIDRLNIRDLFDYIHSGEYETYGKPHPGIFIHVAQALNIKPQDCIVFEDSLNGIIAAKAARMQCIAVPELKNLSNKKYAIADKILPCLHEFEEKMLAKN